MDYTDSEQGQYEMEMAERDEKDRQDTESMLAEYREVRDRMLATTELLFPAGARVCPVGNQSPKWHATVREVDKYHRRDMSADMVFVDWDNGNRFSIKIDEIERVR